PKSSAFTMRRRVIGRSLRQDALDDQSLDGLGLAGRDRGLGVDGADVLQTLVPDPRKRLDLAGHDRWREPRCLELREGGLLAEEREEREDEPPPRPQMAVGALDHAVQRLPAVDAAVVGARGRVAPRAVRGRRHLRRVRADEIEALARDGRVTVADSRVDNHAVEARVGSDRLDRFREDVGRDDRGARLRGQYRGQPESAADLEDPLAGTHGETPAKEKRTSLGGLDRVRNAKHTSPPREEGDARAATCQGREGGRAEALLGAGRPPPPKSWRPRADRYRAGAERPRASRRRARR